MHKSALATVAVVLSGGLTLLSAPPASATIHEIFAQWCSGHEPKEPRGISGGSNADNFAQPLLANGFVGDPVPFADGLLLAFNYDHPAAKVRGTGTYIVIGSTPAGPLYLELIEPDPEFAAFGRCPALAG